MFVRRAIALTTAAAFLSSAAPPPPELQRLPEAQHRATVRSPVRCAPTDAADPRQPYPATIAPRNHAPGPPPPPPPLPPPPSVAPMQNVVVTGSRMGDRRIVGRHIPGRGAPAYGTPGNTERYAGEKVASIVDVAATPVSTFSVDVDTGAYANVRRFLTSGEPVPAEAVRTEEMVNYFRYDYPRPREAAAPFSVTTDVARTPWNPATRLIRIGLRGYDVTGATRPPANLVFLIDVSGSMAAPDKLPLVKTALQGLADQLRPDDRVSIVTYAGSVGVLLEPTSDKRHVAQALACLESGGSTAGAKGIELAYATARANFRKGAVNRIFLATDGDFNVGIDDKDALEALVKRNRDDGITLTTLGFGTGNYNEAMMERIADVGNGNYAYIDSALEARKVLEEQLSATLVTIARDVKVQVEFNPAQISQYRLIGYENRALAEEDFTNDSVDAGDIGVGHQVTALYEVVPAGSAGWTPERRYPANRAAPMRGGGGEAAHVKLRYKLPGGTASREVGQAVPAAALASAMPPRGDMAFACAVAAFGQKLRGDRYLGRFDYADITALAGQPRDYWRQEFVKLAELADRGNARQGGGN